MSENRIYTACEHNAFAPCLVGCLECVIAANDIERQERIIEFGLPAGVGGQVDNNVNTILKRLTIALQKRIAKFEKTGK